MLARRLKIENLRMQREVIKEDLKSTLYQGEASYVYVGEIFPEVVKYFREVEGFEIVKLETEAVLVENQGLPLYRFSICNVELTEQELEEAENYLEKELDPDTRAVLKQLEDLGEEVGWEMSAFK